MNAAKKINDGRERRATDLGDAVREALVKSPMAYTDQVAKKTAEFIADGCNAEKMAALIVAIGECFDQCRRMG